MRYVHHCPVDIDLRIEPVITSLLEARFGGKPQALNISRTPIRGGLESKAVERVVARWRSLDGRERTFRLIAKYLEGSSTREACVYREIVAKTNFQVAPVVFSSELDDADNIVLLLEDVPTVSAWPWRDLPASRAVLVSLAEFHESSRKAQPSVPRWDYESELQSSAISTLEQLNALRLHPDSSSFGRRAIRPVERLVSSLPQRRAELLNFAPFGRGPIHGDVHPGNALVRRRKAGYRPVLIDWGRARMGSALEDVSSWLQSLGYWEPEARRRHDTLLNDYLAAAQCDQRLSADLRAAYWMAGASNALAGALRYYCWRATVAQTVRQRAAALHTANDWLRVIVRADAWSH